MDSFWEIKLYSSTNWILRIGKWILDSAYYTILYDRCFLWNLITNLSLTLFHLRDLSNKATNDVKCTKLHKFYHQWLVWDTLFLYNQKLKMRLHGVFVKGGFCFHVMQHHSWILSYFSFQTLSEFWFFLYDFQLDWNIPTELGTLE